MTRAQRGQEPTLAGSQSINHRHAGFQSRAGSPKFLYFNELPGRPWPNLQNNAQLVHAKFTQAFFIVTCQLGLICCPVAGPE